jgi:hypothetical protein
MKIMSIKIILNEMVMIYKTSKHLRQGFSNFSAGVPPYVI